MKNILVTLVLALIFSACNQTNEKLQTAEGLLMDMPDSSLYILQNIYPDFQDMKDSEKALFGVLFVSASDKMKRPINDYEDLINFSINYYNRTNNKEKLAQSYFYKARIYLNKREDTEATKFLFQALEIAGNSNDASLLAKINADLAQISIYHDEYDKSLEYLDTASSYFNKSGERDNLSKMYLMKGWIYQTTDKYEDALSASWSALNITSDSIIKGDALHDIGMALYLMDQNDSAIYYIKRSLEYPYYSTNKALRYANLAFVFDDLSQNDSATFYLNKALNCDIDIYIARDCYQGLMDISIEQNQTEKTSLYLERYKMCEDSIKKLERQPNINFVEQLHNAGMQTSKAQSKIWILAGLIMIIVLVTALLVIYLVKRNRKEQEKTNSYKSVLQEKHTLQLTEIQHQLKGKREEYAEQRKIADYEQRCMVEKKIYNEVLCIDNEEHFLIKMNKTLNRLPEKLIKDYSNITYKEIVWCCLFILEIPSPDMALLLNYTQTSLYKFKQRLVKKLELKNAKDLEQMLYNKVNL